MHRIWKVLAVPSILAVVAVASHAAGAVEVPIRYIPAETAYSVVKDTPGLDSVTIHLKDNSLSFTGTEDGIDAAKSFLALMDVPQAQVTISATLVRYDRDAAGKVTETVLQNPLVHAVNNIPAAVQSSGEGGDYRMVFTPRVNRDGTVTVSTELAELGPNGAVGPTARTVRRLRPDTSGRLAGLTTSSDMLVRHAVEAGEMVLDRGPYTATYLDITFHRLPSGTSANAAPAGRE
jgi:hypothetical protein